ncbi:peptidoglycan DD-metalloendopeptidase family protein [Paenarthrobacter sp. DKR-5]|uniref:peptidoglycan DD-metalloendopeptidase family protein n=1 Tax=Paenarthrobacter sp. DKR-5 TaxID=2835535 RepID=UPI001BDD04A9|nr:peptidoglycan DD-metalloendopeptidase family protein [Paenarthrobacter sp. DKR-5]MBT1002645.1 peptidoglycan DD-metalloendopeptidase family protein [Paenarthrobacter sp. DKR-5]
MDLGPRRRASCAHFAGAIPDLAVGRCSRCRTVLFVLAALLALCLAAGAPWPAGAGAAAAGPAGTPVQPVGTPAEPAGTASPERPAWTWPLVPRPRVVATFDPPARPWLSGHRGVDLGALPGAPVVAPAAGVVVFAGQVADRPVLTIATASGLRSSVEPVESPLAAGSTVRRGQVIGTLARPPQAGGHCSNGCLHWGVRRGQDYVNPLALLLDLRPSVLLPLEGPPPAPGPQTIAEMPVMARPVTRVLISWVPS